MKNKKIENKLRELDELSADPKLLHYDVICYKCQKKPIECICDDKWSRLHSFNFTLTSARISVSLGGAGEEQHKLVDKLGI